MKIALALVCLVATMAAVAQPAAIIGDIALEPSYAPQDSPVHLQEYIPKGEDISHWSRLASVRIFPDRSDPKDYLGKVAQSVVNKSPLNKAVIFKDDKSGRLVLDFLVFGPKLELAEWNLMRANFVKAKGLVVYQYAMRFYKIDQQMPVTIKAERNKMIVPFANTDFGSP